MVDKPLFKAFLANSMAKTKENSDQGFADRLRLLRTSKSLSQAELADKVGVHFTHISRYERGESRPASKALKALSHALDVSVGYLLEGDLKSGATADIQDTELLRMFEKAAHLPPEDKEYVKKTIQMVIKNREMATVIAS